MTLPTATPSDLAHIPFPPQGPLLGNTFEALRDPVALYRKCTSTLGDVYRVRFFGQWRIQLAGAEGIEYILTDPDKLFSSKFGWSLLTEIFAGGLMLRDFDDHRAHRRIMQAAFKKPAMDSYLALMAPALDDLVADWPTEEPLKFYGAIKDLTLRVGAHVFMGLPVNAPEAALLSKGFVDEVEATLSILRKPLPFTKYKRGLDARAKLTNRFAHLIAERRGAAGEDFFSQMCRATDEDGKAWSDAEIVDHFNFLMMAAHDTTASALTAMVWALTTYPDWQERLRAEVDALGDGPFDTMMLDHMPLTDMVFKEALRMVPPVPLVPRRATRSFDWNGVKIPAGAYVSANVGGVMMSPAYYTDPDRFDPERFSPNRAEDRNHRFAWAPFGGGAHKCIGMHFSSMQVKLFLRALLSRYSLSSASDTPVEWQRLPIPKPKGGLPIKLTPRSS